MADGPKLPVTPVPTDLMISSGFNGYPHTHSHVHTERHIFINKNKFKKNKKIQGLMAKIWCLPMMSLRDGPLDELAILGADQEKTTLLAYPWLCSTSVINSF